MDPNRETLGRYLKRERESHRVAVQEIAHFLGVNSSFIDALEGDDFDVFAGRSECVRLVKQYTAHLKLNQMEVLRLFDAQWKLTGGVKRYPKLTQFADGDSFRVQSVLLKGKGLTMGHSSARRIGLSVVVGALIVFSVIFIDFPDTKRETMRPDRRPPAGTEIGVLPAKDIPHPPAADMERRTVSLKQVSRPEASHPQPGVAEGKTPPQPKGVKVIGNRDSKRYHLPGMKYYDLVKAYHRVVFQSEKEAVRAGYRRALE
jgi:cytoskeletal protein RodZ